jgi:flagellar protein FlaG
MAAVSFNAPSTGLQLALAPLAVAGTGEGAPAASAAASGDVRTVSAGGPPAPVAAPPSPQTTSATKANAKVLTPAELQSAIYSLQVKMDKLNPALSFVVDQSTGHTLIQLTDRETKEVIQQFPSEVALQIARAIDRFQKGMLVDRTA